MQNFEMFYQKAFPTKNFKKKYPNTLDNAFLKWYLCIVIRKTTQLLKNKITNP